MEEGKNILWRQYTICMGLQQCDDIEATALSGSWIWWVRYTDSITTGSNERHHGKCNSLFFQDQAIALLRLSPPACTSSVCTFPVEVMDARVMYWPCLSEHMMDRMGIIHHAFGVTCRNSWRLANQPRDLVFLSEINKTSYGQRASVACPSLPSFSPTCEPFLPSQMPL